MPGNRGRRRFAIALTLRLVQHLDFGDHVRGLGVIGSGPLDRIICGILSRTDGNAKSDFRAAYLLVSSATIC